MPNFYVAVKRHQIQTALFVVDSQDEQSLKDRLSEIESENGFAEIDNRFDSGEVDSIDYEVLSIEPTNIDFIDEDLQNLLK